MELAQQRRGEYVDMQYLTETRTTLVYKMPLAEVRPLGGACGGRAGWNSTWFAVYVERAASVHGAPRLANARASAAHTALARPWPTLACVAFACPACQVVTDFFDALKSRSRGYASMEYSITG